jgi:hypothetical protein
MQLYILDGGVLLSPLLCYIAKAINGVAPVKIAEALLLRKQLEQKVEQLRPIKLRGDEGMFETKVERRKVSEDVDEATIMVPRVNLSDITKQYDHYATELRKIDASIQRANWEFDVSYTETPPPKDEHPKK